MTAGDPRGWMWDEALAVIERAQHLHRRFFELGFSPIQAPVGEPPVDIFETDRELWIVVALPGAEADDLDVSIDTDTLRVDAAALPPILGPRKFENEVAMRTSVPGSRPASPGRQSAGISCSSRRRACPAATS
jgi:HSP20 family molecular chaperone IbpA